MNAIYRIFLGLCALCLVLNFGGCSSSPANPNDTKLLAKIGVTYAVIKVTEKHPEKAARILAISQAVREVAGSDGFNTVSLLMAFVRTKVDVTKLDPADQMLAKVLLDEIESQLKARIGSGTLSTDKLLIVGEVAGWIEDAARLAQVPAPAAK